MNKVKMLSADKWKQHLLIELRHLRAEGVGILNNDIKLDCNPCETYLFTAWHISSVRDIITE